MNQLNQIGNIPVEDGYTLNVKSPEEVGMTIEMVLMDSLMKRLPLERSAQRIKNLMIYLDHFDRTKANGQTGYLGKAESTIKQYFSKYSEVTRKAGPVSISEQFPAESRAIILFSALKDEATRKYIPDFIDPKDVPALVKNPKMGFESCLDIFQGSPRHLAQVLKDPSDVAWRLSQMIDPPQVYGKHTPPRLRDVQNLAAASLTLDRVRRADGTSFVEAFKIAAKASFSEFVAASRNPQGLSSHNLPKVLGSGRALFKALLEQKGDLNLTKLIKPEDASIFTNDDNLGLAAGLRAFQTSRAHVSAGVGRDGLERLAHYSVNTYTPHPTNHDNIVGDPLEEIRQTYLVGALNDEHRGAILSGIQKGVMSNLGRGAIGNKKYINAMIAKDSENSCPDIQEALKSGLAYAVQAHAAMNSSPQVGAGARPG